MFFPIICFTILVSLLSLLNSKILLTFTSLDFFETGMIEIVYDKLMKKGKIIEKNISLLSKKIFWYKIQKILNLPK